MAGILLHPCSVFHLSNIVRPRIAYVRLSRPNIATCYHSAYVMTIDPTTVFMSKLWDVQYNCSLVRPRQSVLRPMIIMIYLTPSYVRRTYMHYILPFSNVPGLASKIVVKKNRCKKSVDGKTCTGHGLNKTSLVTVETMVILLPHLNGERFSILCATYNYALDASHLLISMKLWTNSWRMFSISARSHKSLVFGGDLWRKNIVFALKNSVTEGALLALSHNQISFKHAQIWFFVQTRQVLQQLQWRNNELLC